MLYPTKMKFKLNRIIISTLLLATWSSRAESDGTSSEKPSMGQREPFRWDSAQVVNEFGYKLITNLMKEDVGANIVISPTGVYGLLAMTLLGSVGTTYDELAKVLGFSQDILTNRENHQQFGELLRSLSYEDVSSKTLYADAVVVDEHVHIRDIYRDYVKQVYNGEALTIKFSDHMEAMNLINGWINNHTNKQIQDFLEQPLPMNTQIVLLSALYFNGQWEKPFVPEYTIKMRFASSSTKEVMADLMLNMGKFNYTYSTSQGLQIIAFPYNDSMTNMYVLKPLFPKETSLMDLLDRLDYNKIDALINQMRDNENCVIRFPKMELKTKTKLQKSLKALGINSLFSPTEANLALMIDSKATNNSQEELITRINSGDVEESSDLKYKLNSLPNPGLYVDSVLHDVKMTINEYGTEAAAAASGILTRTAHRFLADSPFYMFIRNEKTKLVTFSAVIFDPTA